MTATASDISRLEQILQLPAIKQAFDEATQAEEDQAAAARAAVLAKIASAENALEAQKGMAAGLAAEIGHAREHLNDLLARNVQQAEETKRQGRHLTDLNRTLDRDHGGNLIKQVVRHLRAQETAMRDQAARLEVLQVQARNHFGDVVLKPDEVSKGKAAEKRAMADRMEIAWREIESLERAAIAPAEIKRRINQAVAGLGLGQLRESTQREGWRIEGWNKGKSRDFPNIDQPADKAVA